MEENKKPRRDEPDRFYVPVLDGDGFSYRWEMSDDERRQYEQARKRRFQLPSYRSGRQYRYRMREPACFYQWANTATGQIMLPSVKDQVRSELYAHFLDRREDLLFRGMEESEANKQAVAMLGDPNETGLLLQKVHVPWLRILLHTVRVVLVILVLLVGWMLLRGGSFGTVSRNTILTDIGIVASRSNRLEERVIARRAGSCADELDFGPFHVSCDTVSFQITHGRYNFDDPTPWYYELDQETCAVLLRFTAAPWYDPDLPQLRVVDDQGREILRDHASDNVSPRISLERVWRELPWRTVVGIRFQNIPDEVRWLDIYLEHEGYSEKLRVKLGPWQSVAEELPRMGDGAEALRSLLDSPCYPYNQPIQVRSAETTEPKQLSGYEVSIPWAREARYETNPDLPGSEKLCLGECVLMIRGDANGFPIPFHQKQWRITLFDADAAEEEADLRWASRRKLWYGDGLLYRLYWKAIPGVDRYLLRFTAPDEESCTMEIVLEEEENLP